MKCLLDACKRSFGKIGLVASEEVILHLIFAKCIPILLHGLESFSLCQYQLKSLDFVINTFFMKLFKTSDIHVVSECQELFGFDLPSVQLARRTKKFFDKFEHYRVLLLS